MDDDANIYDVRFCKSAIHSVASLTYDEAQVMLDTPAPKVHYHVRDVFAVSYSVWESI
jgi:exoribonuclease R